MEDRMRVSDADREAVTTRLRDHFAEGRLTPGELDERVTAALNAKTFGELRSLTADLPGPAPVPPPASPPPFMAAQPHWGGPACGGPPWGGRPWRRHYRLPVLLFVLIALLVTVASGGWVLFAFFRLILLFWLVAILVRIAFGVMGRRWHRYR